MRGGIACLIVAAALSFLALSGCSVGSGAASPTPAPSITPEPSSPVLTLAPEPTAPAAQATLPPPSPPPSPAPSRKPSPTPSQAPSPSPEALFAPGERAKRIIGQVLDCAAHPLALTVETDVEGENTVLSIYMEGENLLIELRSASMHTGSLLAGGDARVILYDDMAWRACPADGITAMRDGLLSFAAADPEAYDYVSGKAQRFGETVDYDLFSDGSSTVSFLYTEDSDEWICLVLDGEYWHIISVSDTLPQGVFDLPEDFKEIT